MEKTEASFQVLLLTYFLRGTLMASYLASSLLKFIGSLIICGSRPFIGLLKSNVAGLHSTVPKGADHICNID